jgi:hypothetical protein
MIMTIFIDKHDDQYASIFDAIIHNDFDVDLIYKTKSSALFSAKMKCHWHFVKANSD